MRIVVQQLAPGFVQQMQTVCPQCRGKGTDVREEDKCQTCKGKQITEDKKVFEVHIEAGMKTGDFITFTGEGDQIPGVQASGDVIILLKERPHPFFKRKGKALVIEQTLTLADALCGFELVIPHLDGRKILIRSQEGQVIKPSTIYLVGREGMPVKGTGGSEKGDLVVTVNVIFPDSLNSKQSEALRKVLGALKPPPKPLEGEDFYETHLEECLTSVDDLAGKEEDDDEEEAQGGSGGTRVQCAQQ